MTFRAIMYVAMLLAGSAIAVRSVAQPADAVFAADRVIVKVREDVLPAVLPDGRLTLAHTQDMELPEAIFAEFLIADFLAGCGATSIEPLIHFELEGEVLARATENGVTRQYIIDLPAGVNIGLVTDFLSVCITHVEYATPDWYGQLQTTDPLFDEQWSLENTGQPLNFPCPDVLVGCGDCGNGEGLMGTEDADIDAPEAWALESGISNVVVAVIDSGADMDHPDLNGKLVSGQNFARGECPDACDLPGQGSCPSADCDTLVTSHGTFIAGIIAAAHNVQGIAGVAPGSPVMPLRVQPSAPSSEVKAALMFAANEDDVRVISMSFTAKQDSLDLEIQTLFDLDDKLMVAAAGNCFGPPPPGGCANPVAYPANDPRVVAVTATNFKDERACFAHLGPELSVAAPGEDIVSAVNPDYVFDACNPDTSPDFYCRSNGTSWAAPHVAAVAALISSANIALSAVEVRRIIEITADDLGSVGHDDEFGCGRINAFQAVCRAICPANLDDVCSVGINDFLALLAAWGDCADQCCPADLDDDGLVGISDFLALLAAWGPCGLGPPPASLAEEVAAAGLTQTEWDLLVDCVANGTPAESNNCACWIHHYMDCHRPTVCIPDTVLCAGSDPLGHH